jgi:small subunit ribosomal protein S9
MVTKKTVKKAEPKPKKKKAKEEKVAALVEKKVVEEVKAPAEKYFYAVGKRKASIARVKLYLSKDKETAVEINGKELASYFGLERLRNAVLAPFSVVANEKFFVSAKTYGGGMTGQAEAIRLGISKALVIMNEELKKGLKDLGFMTRDARVVERKKPGRKKARRSPQWAKR